MKGIFELLKKEKKYYTTVVVTISIFFILSIIQNIIRYGAHEGYNVWRTVLYLSVSLTLFLPLLPLVFYLLKKVFHVLNKYYWLMSVLITVCTIVVFYFLSGIVVHFFGFNEAFISLKYARQYFGREALYHLLILIGTVYYIYTVSKVRSPKKVSGMLGRKEMTVKADLIHWIEADDHYLKIHTQDWALIKRSSLEKMAKALNPDFIRIHRKFLVNKSAIVSTERNQRNEFVILQSGERLKVGRTYSPLEL